MSVERLLHWQKLSMNNSSPSCGGGGALRRRFFCQSSCVSLLLISLLLASILCGEASAQEQDSRKRFTMRQREKQILDDILGPKYDTKIRPGPSPQSKSGETQVDVNLLLRSVSKIDDFNMEYSVQMLMREEWFDDRLRYDQFRRSASADFPPYLTVSDTTRVWMPDIFFINEKQGHLHALIKPNAYVRIFPGGQVLYSVRISLVLSCPMYLHFFPMDRQKCSILMASYGLPTEDLIFNWKSVEPVQVPNLTLPRFELEDVRTKTYDRVTNTGGYSTLQVDFILRRNFSYYMTQMYIPCIMLVIVSQVSFWIDENAVPARTALGITTLLTMATQSASINRSLPPVSYTKAMDVWTGVCLAFVFGALLEYAFVNYNSRFDKRIKSKWQEEHGQAPRPISGCLAKRYPNRSKRIDVIARIVFPLLFLLFNIAYWTVCLTAGDDFDEDV